MESAPFWGYSVVWIYRRTSGSREVVLERVTRSSVFCKSYPIRLHVKDVDELIRTRRDYSEALCNVRSIFCTFFVQIFLCANLS